MNSKINLIFDLKGSERKLSINKYFNNKNPKLDGFKVFC